MKKILIYVVYIFSCIFIFTACSNGSMTIKENVDNSNYISVALSNSQNKINVDLKSKRYYGDGYASNGDIFYSNNHPYRSKNFGFDNFKAWTLTYPLIANSTTINEVRRSNYVIEKKITNTKYKEFFNESGWVNNKVKIFYNHKCLPVKVQTMNSRTKKWTTHIKLSYYKSTHKEYKKKWNAYVKRIKAGEFEDE